MKKVTQRKRVGFRTSEEFIKLIDQAAELQGMNRSSFIKLTMEKEARDVLQGCV